MTTKLPMQININELDPEIIPPLTERFEDPSLITSVEDKYEFKSLDIRFME
jgi:hypothetical protein